MTTHLPIVSVSQMRTFNTCRREHRFRYGLGYRAIATVVALRFGTLMHVGLETWWKWLMQARADDKRDGLLQYVLGQIRIAGDPDPFELVKAEELMRGYHYRWIDDPIANVLEVEREFRAPLLNPETQHPSRTFELGGKIDAVARIGAHPERSPGVYVVEHKTTSKEIGLGSVYWTRLRLDSQVSVYFEGARSLGHDVVGCLYDVIKKPTLRPSKATPVEDRKMTLAKYKKHEECKGKGCFGCEPDGRVLVEPPRYYANVRIEDETPEEFRVRLREDIAENPDKYYQRGTVVRLEEEMRDAGFDTWQTARNIREGELADRHPRNTNACERYSQLCEFFDVCSGVASLDDESRFRKVERVHEELEAV